MNRESTTLKVSDVNNTIFEDISKERLGEMGVKAGHQVKIIKKIKE